MWLIYLDLIHTFFAYFSDSKSPSSERSPARNRFTKNKNRGGKSSRGRGKDDNAENSGFIPFSGSKKNKKKQGKQ